MKVVTVVGARPQFIKAAPLSRALRAHHHEVIVHTGQHYDENMSAVFFRELAIPKPDYHLEIGSGPHGKQTGRMMAAIEEVLLSERPDWVLLYGDTNSTIAGALAASKLNIPIAHVEAGLRSFNRRMPEEINRIVTDRLSTLLFCSSDVGAEHLAREGVVDGVHVVGDIMADELYAAVQRLGTGASLTNRMGLMEKGYVLATLHRAENTNSADRLRSIMDAFRRCGQQIIMPLHPRTRKALQDLGLETGPSMRVLDPLGYLDFISLAKSALAIMTDSGGLQKEAYWLGVPCITLRDETEWVETVANGWNRLAGADTEAILAALSELRIPRSHPQLYGDGKAATACVEILSKHQGRSAS